MSRERTPLAELELELERQDQSFRQACAALAALGDDVRLSIPQHVLEELDAAFQERRPARGELGRPFPVLRA